MTFGWEPWGRRSAELIAIVGAMVAGEMPAHAQAQVGDARDALPGIVHVPVAGAIERTGIAAAGTAGYGYTEGVLGQGDHHDRLFATLAASVRPTPWLALALRFDGRYDHHSDPVGGSASGFVGDPRLAVRTGTDLAHGFRIGAELGLWVPGDQAPSLVFAASTLDLRLLAAYAPPDSAVVIATHAGGRWDNSAASVSDVDRLSPSNRLGLGLNEASAILTGLGVSWRVKPRVELLADVSVDWLVGSRAPSALESPIRVALGARWNANESGTLALQWIVESSPSGRPPVAAGQPLVDVEPLVSASFGLVLRPRGPAAPAAPSAPEPPPDTNESHETGLVVAATGTVRGRITSRAGAPLAHAQMSLKSTGAEVRAAETDADGAFEFTNVPLGAATLDAQATGFVHAARDVTVDAHAPVDATTTLDPVVPSAQIRGVVRDFAGKAVAATVVIEPLGTTATVKPDGSFEVDVPPGTYDVVITASGYTRQKRHAVVEKEGVTLLNVDLRSAR